MTLGLCAAVRVGIIILPDHDGVLIFWAVTMVILSSFISLFLLAQKFFCHFISVLVNLGVSSSAPLQLF